MADIPIDAVEIKCTLSDASLEPAMTSFGLVDPDRKRQIRFFDSIDPVQNELRLLRAGSFSGCDGRRTGQAGAPSNCGPLMANSSSATFGPVPATSANATPSSTTGPTTRYWRPAWTLT